MNVSELVRGLFNNMHQADGKSLQLKLGQIVKGTVVQLLGAQEAIVQIDGMPVKVHLSAPLLLGESSLLQVMPQSMNGEIVMKPVAQQTANPGQSKIATMLLNSAEFKQEPLARTIVQAMLQNGVPIDKQAVRQMLSILPQIAGKNVPPDVIHAGILAMQRNLPLTAEGVRGIHQVVYGPPMHVSIEQLAAQLQSWLTPATNAMLQQQPQQFALIDRLQQLLHLFMNAAPSKAPSLNGTVPMNNLNHPGTTSHSSINVTAGTQGNTPGASAATITSQSSVAATMPANAMMATEAPIPSNVQTSTTVTGTTVNQQGSTTQQASVNQTAQPLINPNLSAGASATTESLTAQVHSQSASTAGQAQAEATTHTPATTMQAPVNQQKSDTWIARFFQQMGIQHEQQLYSQVVRHDGVRVVLTNEEPSVHAMMRNEAAPQTDNLKGLLMLLNQADQVPPAIKDAAQQLLQQITGQQLLLTPDRSAVMIQLSMMIPFFHESGKQTASVHIQSRKKNKNELDTDNCRIWFDLQMEALGATMLDMQIIERQVSLHVHNSHPSLNLMLDSNKELLRQALSTQGYQLISMKGSPFPKLSDTEKSDLLIGNDLRLDHFTVKPYRGVDYRV